VRIKILKKLIISRLEERKAIYYPIFVRALDELNAALLLSHLIILTLKRHEDCWIERTTDEFLRETGLTRAEQETARRRLRACNILKEKKINKFSIIYFKLDLKKVFKMLKEYMEEEKVIDLKKEKTRQKNSTSKSIF